MQSGVFLAKSMMVRLPKQVRVFLECPSLTQRDCARKPVRDCALPQRGGATPPAIQRDDPPPPTPEALPRPALFSPAACENAYAAGAVSTAAARPSLAAER